MGNFLTVVSVIVVILSLFVFSTTKPRHAPHDEGSEAFFAKCHDVGFTPEQCKFFRYGTRDPNADPERVILQ